MIEKMFLHQGKLSRMVGEKKIETYRMLYEHLKTAIENQDLPLHPDYLCGNDLANNIYKKKYYLKDINGEFIERRPEDVFCRIASFIASQESTKTKQKTWAEIFYKDLYEGYWMPGGRVLAGAGDLYRLKTLANCFVTRIEGDNIESIYKAAAECARTYSYGGGIGVDITPLRPRGSVVHNAADTSTGAVSFMELFSMTTGLIGQSGRRGALMLTIDIKHPDIFHFIHVKKTPNWVSQQIVEQCRWSGKFNESQLDLIKKQVVENTQIRFANISVKVTDEFMSAVQEEKKYGRDRIIVYKKKNKKRLMKAYQKDGYHYSLGIPCKDIREYEELHIFDSYALFNQWFEDQFGRTSSQVDLKDALKRDVYGDFLIDIGEEDEELAIHYTGDFLLYFASDETHEIRELVKARDIWDTLIESNYRTAEPGLMFWTKMSRYSPSNYVGRPIICTNPCAEVPLEDGGACNLGSINLARFVKNGFM
ncbi:MAG: ribonucleotide reductase N-terminal alpha domain-containing protein, partial [Candidatus Marinimicrobia bacterium]|nr:ribonucleotide reductase N-terminal alpha domain-containing protein [Candidatus Neomarinimicrobiota bacterium]